MDANQKFVDGLRFYRLTAEQRRSAWIPVCVWGIGAVVAYVVGPLDLFRLLVALIAGYGAAWGVFKVTALSWNYQQFISQGWRARSKNDGVQS